jgi:alpha-L-rhamnosidase
VSLLDQEYLIHNWQRYIRAPETPIARPIRIVSTSGNVEDAGALITPEPGRLAILTRRGSDTEPTNIVLDYGMEVGGVPSFDVVAASGSPELKASYSEYLGYVGVDGDHGGTHSADRHRYDVYTVTQPAIITNTYIQGGQRYQMISLTTPGSVSLGSVSIQLTHYVASPGEYRGHFVCSDEDLNRIWYASAYTVQTNMLPSGSVVGALSNDIPVIVDGAKRDRSVWSGDLAVQGPVDYYSTFATEYVRDSIKLLGSNASADGRVSTNLNAEWPVHTGGGPSPHERIYSSNYTLWWVRLLADYYLYTNDEKFLVEQWPILTKELAWASTQVNKDGLFITNKSNGLDWDYYDGPKLGAVTAFNALYYRALIDGSDMADAVGERDQARTYRFRATLLRNSINNTLFNSETGLYDASDQERGTIAQDANVFAILFGVAPEDKVGPILTKLKGSLWTTNGPRPFGSERYRPLISPFISGFELMARFQTGDDEAGFDLLSRLWLRMSGPGNDETSTVWENMSLDGKPGLGMNTSLAHGWAAMPLVALSSQVLGIQPVTAGYSTWSIRPHPGGLDWAEGSVPTPAGEINVRWEHARGPSQFKLHISAPKGTVGLVSVPNFGKSVQVIVNGTVAWSGSAVGGFSAYTDGSYLILNQLPGGTYDISSRSEP